MAAPRRRLFPVHVFDAPGGAKLHHGVLLYQNAAGVRIFARASAGAGEPVPGHPAVHLVATLDGATLTAAKRAWELRQPDGTVLHVVSAPGCRSCGNPLGKYRPT